MVITGYLSIRCDARSNPEYDRRLPRRSLMNHFFAWRFGARPARAQSLFPAGLALAALLAACSSSSDGAPPIDAGPSADATIGEAGGSPEAGASAGDVGASVEAAPGHDAAPAVDGRAD